MQSTTRKGRIATLMVALVMLLSILPTDIALSAGKAKIAKKGSISGAVWLDKDGDGKYDKGKPRMAGMLVLLSTRKSLSSAIRTAVTDSKGRYKFRGIRRGAYYVTVCESSGECLPKTAQHDNDLGKTGYTGKLKLKAGGKLTKVNVGMLKRAKRRAPLRKSTRSFHRK